LKAVLVVVAAAAAVVIIAAVFILLSTMGSGASGVVETRSFRLEATIVEKQSGGEFRSTSVVEWQDERHFRNTLTSPYDSGFTGTLSADGEWRWVVVDSMPTYTRLDLREAPPDAPVSPLFYRQIGPTARAHSIDDLLDDLREQHKEFGPGKPWYARVTGQETYLGIPVTVIEYGPLWNDSSPEKLANNWTINTGGSARMWIDPETMFILRSEAEVQDGMSYRVEVTSLDFDPEFAPGTFDFVPPPGKTEVIE